MPLTRRVQVFIGEEASAALDRIVARGLSITEAVERGLLRIDPRFLPDYDDGTTTRQVEQSPERTQAHKPEGYHGVIEARGESSDQFAEQFETTFNSPEVAKKKAERKERKGKLAESVKEALPLARLGAQPIPKPGKK